MANVTVQSRITPELKAQAESILNAIGLSTADSIRVFLQQVVNSNGLPFQPVVKQPNIETLAAMRDEQDGNVNHAKTSDDFYRQLGI